MRGQPDLVAHCNSCKQDYFSSHGGNFSRSLLWCAIKIPRKSDSLASLEKPPFVSSRLSVNPHRGCFLCSNATRPLSGEMDKEACRFPHIQTRNSPALWARIQRLFPWTCGSERIQQRWDTILSVGNDLCVRIRVSFRPPAVWFYMIILLNV